MYFLGRTYRPHLTVLRALLLVAAAFYSFFSSDSDAQVPPPITASGLNTVVTPSGNVYNITGGTRPGGGGNLFHSFGNFNVPTNKAANFLNDTGLPTSNILGRVTGGNPSSIFGMIQTTGFGNANLFLMNPAGFLFGPNATLHVGGMVAFTTADYLRLQGIHANGTFYADPGKASVLTNSPVAAFGFLGSNPAAIAIQGSTLKVADGKALSLVGGNQGFVATDPDTGAPIPVTGGITMAGGKLLAPGGQINLASVAGPGEISAVNLTPTRGMMMGNVRLSEGALLDVSADGAGTVRIRGGQLVMDQARISADTANANGAPMAIDIDITGGVSILAVDAPGLTARTSGSGNAGEVRISAQNIEVTATATDPSTFSVIDTHTSGSGKGGDVILTAIDNLKASKAIDSPNAVIFINSGTVGLDGGQGGNVTLDAKNVELTRADIYTGDWLALQTGDFASGSGGNLAIKADTFSMVNSGLATTAAFGGIGGDLTISARDAKIITGSFLDANGAIRGGTIRINANHLSVESSQIDSGGGIIFDGGIAEFTDGSTVSASTGFNDDAGNITFTATERLTFTDPTSVDACVACTFLNRPSGVFTTTVFGSGNGGIITVNTPLLQLSGGARFDATTQTSGNGGTINITAGTLSISGGRSSPILEGPLFGLVTSLASGIYSRTVQSRFCSGPCGNAGPISITSNSLNLSQGGRIDSDTTSAGRGGNITVNANQISVIGTTTDSIGSGINSTASATGSGGNIGVTASQSVSISNGGSISVSTTGAGNAGNILVKASDIAITSGGTVTAASTGAGNAGTVTIQGLSSPANSLLVDGAGSGVFTTTSAAGTGGSITIEANAVTLQNGAQLSSSSTGPGSTGNININAGNQFAMTNSSMTTEATQSGGGAIKITTNPNGTVQLTDSTISASVLDGAGGGGSVNIDPQSVVLINSSILANAVSGPGGNISITTNLLLPDTASVISASSQFGQQGTITIQSPISPASGKIVPLGQKPLLATSLLTQRCAALAGGNISSFTVAGRDTLPAEPGGWLSNPIALSIPESENGTVKEADGSILDQTPLLSLRKISPPGFLTQAFGVHSSGCQS